MCEIVYFRLKLVRSGITYHIKINALTELDAKQLAIARLQKAKVQATKSELIVVSRQNIKVEVIGFESQITQIT